jgi:hypothetical protein
MAGHGRSKNGVAEFTLGLAEGKTRGLAYVPAIHVLLGRRCSKKLGHAPIPWDRSMPWIIKPKA